MDHKIRFCHGSSSNTSHGLHWFIHWNVRAFGPMNIISVLSLSWFSCNKYCDIQALISKVHLKSSFRGVCTRFVQFCTLFLRFKNLFPLLFSGNIYFLFGQIHSSEVQQHNWVSMVGLCSWLVVHSLLNTHGSHLDAV